jgi:hypothetical protein
MKTLEAARASAEQDLRAAIRQEPADDARIGSLAAEIVAFGNDLTAIESETQSQLVRLLCSPARFSPSAHTPRTP